MNKKAFYEFVDEWVRGWRSLAYRHGNTLSKELSNFLIYHRVKEISYNEELRLIGVTLTHEEKEYLYLSQLYKSGKYVAVVDKETNKKLFEATNRTPTIEEGMFKDNRDLFIPENHLFGLPALNFAEYLDRLVRRLKKIDT